MNFRSSHDRLCRRAAFLLALLAAQTASAQDSRPAKRPFLWLVEGKTPSFLFGTIHLATDEILDLPPVVETALERCDSLCTEIPMDIGAMTREMTPRMMLPKDKTLKEILPKETYERADRYLKARGMKMAAMDRFQVWAASMQISLADAIKQVGAVQGLDMHLYQEAQSMKKETGGLETAAEQIAALECLTVEEQIASLNSTLKRLEEYDQRHSRYFSKLLDRYAVGDDRSLWKLMLEFMDPDDPVDRKSFDLLITQRDKRMADRIAAKLKANPERSYMFAVGAAHLIGPEENIITHLEAAGYRIRRLSLDDSKAIPKRAVGATKSPNP
ncbi:MAG: TraB/GumN family protein [Planctomycetes bacterium]|nr:TraB/GumN family protein [Planctomycetota bacterium]